MTMSTEQEREHFSHWIATAVPFDKNVGMVEHSIKTDAAWHGWMARAASEDFCEVLRNEYHMTKALPTSAELERLAVEAGMVNLLNHGAASCVYSEGCHGVTQEHLERFAELARKRKPLTLEQIAALEAGCSHQSVDWDTRVSLVRSVERAHGIGA